MHLNVIADAPPCWTCDARCCTQYIVPITAYDVWRLVRALSVPWREVAEVRPGDPDFFDCFRLDATTQRHTLFLRRQPSGACGLLVQLGDGRDRCGAHVARPFVCRAYPLKHVDEPPHVAFISHAMCPPPQRAMFDAGSAAATPALDDEWSERMLHVRLIERWDQLAATLPPGERLGVDEFVRWSATVYDALVPLRVGPRATWDALAAHRVADFPLPELYTSGC